MSKIFGFSFSKQTGTSISEKRKTIKKVQSRGISKHLQPGIDIGGQSTTQPPTGGTNQEIEYMMWFGNQFNTIKVDGVDATSTTPSGLFYPVLLTAGSIDPQNLLTIDVTDPFPWAITVYADSTEVVFGQQDEAAGYEFLWPPSVQGG